MTRSIRDFQIEWLKTTFKSRPNLGMVHLQETKFNTPKEARDVFIGLGGKIIGILNVSDGRKHGVVTWIPEHSPIYNLVEQIQIDTIDGRWAILRIAAKQELLHVINVYAPSEGKSERETFFDGVKDTFDLPNLMMVGDWNFVAEAMDNVKAGGCVEPTDHPKTNAMLANLELEDVFRCRNEEIIEMIFVHSNGTHQARLDRFYVQQHILGQCDSLQTIPSLKVSDHEAIGMTYNDPIPRDRIEEPHYGLSRALLKAIANTESNLRWEIDRICNEGSNQIRQATKREE